MFNAAAIAAAVVALLSFPIVAYQALPGANGQLVLHSRFDLVIKLTAFTFMCAVAAAAFTHFGGNGHAARAGASAPRWENGS